MKPCTYCHKYLPYEELTPLYEENKPQFVRVYCDKCRIEVNSSLLSFQRAYLKWGQRGEYRPAPKK